MAITLQEENQGKVLAVQVSGKLVQEDYAHFVPEVNRLIQQHGKISILFEMHDFHGWSAAALWEDTKFAVTHFNDIARLAVVGEKRWHKGMARFCKPFTRADIRYFDRAHEEEAQNWLQTH